MIFLHLFTKFIKTIKILLFFEKWLINGFKVLITDWISSEYGGLIIINNNDIMLKQRVIICIILSDSVINIVTLSSFAS